MSGVRDMAHKASARDHRALGDDPLKDAYLRFSGAVLAVSVKTPDGDHGTGTAFHIGDGWLVTAAHVVGENSIEAIWPSASLRDGSPGVRVLRRILHPDPAVDLALIETDFRGPEIEIGGHLDDWIDDDQFVLSRVLTMGFPPVPLTTGPVLVAATGEVSVLADSYLGPRSPYFLVSSVARGGFSGAPVISELGFLLGIMTQSFVKDGQPPEMGFAAALTVEPLWDLLDQNDILPGVNAEFLRELRDPGSTSLSTPPPGAPDS